MPILKNNVFNYNFENRFKTTFLSARDDVRVLGATNVVINLPTIIIGYTEQPTSIRKIWIPGDSMEFEDMNLQFMLQEGMENWLAIMDWMFRLRDPDTIDLERDVVDIAIDILDSKFNPIVLCTAIDCFPFTISDVPLNTQVEDVEPARFDVSFKLNGFKYESVSA